MFREFENFNKSTFIEKLEFLARSFKVSRNMFPSEMPQGN